MVLAELGEDAEHRLAQVVAQLGVGDPHGVDQVAEAPARSGRDRGRRGRPGRRAGRPTRASGATAARRRPGRSSPAPARSAASSARPSSRSSRARATRAPTWPGSRSTACAQRVLVAARPPAGRPRRARAGRGRPRSPAAAAGRRTRRRPRRRGSPSPAGCSSRGAAWARPGFESMSTFASTTAPSRRSTASSRIGVSCRHGPHHAAQKSTTTGTSRERSITSASNVASVTSMPLQSVAEPLEGAEAAPGGRHGSGQGRQWAARYRQGPCTTSRTPASPRRGASGSPAGGSGPSRPRSGGRRSRSSAAACGRSSTSSSYVPPPGVRAAPAALLGHLRRHRRLARLRGADSPRGRVRYAGRDGRRVHLLHVPPAAGRILPTRWCSTTSRCRSSPAPRSACSAPTGRASPRCCGSWPGSTASSRATRILAPGATVGPAAAGARPRRLPGRARQRRGGGRPMPRCCAASRRSAPAWARSSRTRWRRCSPSTRRSRTRSSAATPGTSSARSRSPWTRCGCRPATRTSTTLSGGERRRVALCRLLLSRARPAAAGRAHEPPRRRVGRLARALPRGVRRAPSSR